MRRLLALLAGLALCASAAAKVVVEELNYADGATKLKGYLAYDDASKARRPGVLVLPEWWGMTPHLQDYARDLAAHGYTALAVDMYGKVAADKKEAGELMNGVMQKPGTMQSRFEAAKRMLVAHPSVDPGHLAAIGFSMGGRIVLQMARSGEDLAAVAVFYGNLATETPAKAGAAHPRVLVLNAAGDPYVEAKSVAAFKQEMDAANVKYKFVDYPGARHGFANPLATEYGKKFDMPIAYDAETDRRARAEMFAFLEEVFGKR